MVNYDSAGQVREQDGSVATWEDTGPRPSVEDIYRAFDPGYRGPGVVQNGG